MKNRKNNSRIEATSYKNDEFAVYNLKAIYKGFRGIEKYAISTLLTEEELRLKYRTELQEYEPFIVISMEVAAFFEADELKEKSISRNERRRRNVYIDDFDNKSCPKNMGLDHADPIINNKILNDALKTLKIRSREIVIDKVVLGYTVDEVARMTGCTVSAVYKDVERSLKKLRAVMEKMEEEERKEDMEVSA